MSYTHFTPSERIQLYELRVTENRSIGAIARLVDCQSPPGNEISRLIAETG